MINNEINFNEVLLSNQYEIFKEELKTDIINNIDIRNGEVNVSFDGTLFSMSQGNLLTFIILAKPFNKYNVSFTEDFIFDVSNMNEYNDYFNSVIQKFIDKPYIKNYITEVIDELARLSGQINLNYGSTISLKQFIDIGKRNKRFVELLNFKLDDDASIQFDEIGEKINSVLKESIDIIINDNDNTVKNYLLSGAGINTKQLGQIINIVGPKPDLYENIIPYPINSSFARGLDVRDHFINAIGCRKALITNHHQVRKSGYLTRKLSLLNIDVKLDDMVDCGTKHLLPVFIEDKNILSKLKYRYYLDDNTDTLKIIDINDESLIGETVMIRTPITCACNNSVCRTCYGELSKINNDLSIGMISVLLLTNPLTQRLLSAKHLLQANASKIEWGNIFESNFTINRNLIIPKSNTMKIFIYKDDLEEDEEIDSLTFSKFEIMDINDGRLKEVRLPLSLIIDYDVFESMGRRLNEDGYYEFNMDQVTSNDYLFSYIMENNGLSASLIAIKDLIEKNEYIKSHTIEEVLNHFLNLLNVANLGIHSVHIELILREMLFVSDGDRSLFKESNFPQYEIFRVADSLLNNKSLGKSLLFEQLSKQLKTLSTGSYDKVSNSMLDKLIL